MVLGLGVYTENQGWGVYTFNIVSYWPGEKSNQDE